MKIGYYADFRFPGGASRHLARELRLARSLGHEVVLIPVTTERFGANVPWHPDLVAAASEVVAHLLPAGERVSLDRAVIRHPVDTLPHILQDPPVDATWVHVVVNQPWRGLEGLQDQQANFDRLAEHLGSKQTWWAIDEKTDESLARAGMTASGRWWPAAALNHRGLVARDFDRSTIVTCGSVVHGSGWQLPKRWPEERDVLVVAPPDADGETRVRLEEWAAQTGARFLEVDESRSRIVLTSDDDRMDVARNVVHELVSLADWSTGGKSFGALRYASLLGSTDVPPRIPYSAGEEVAATMQGADRSVRNARAHDTMLRASEGGGRSRVDARRPRVLFITSNGAGMGHLTRELGIARALGDRAAPIFFSMSQGVPVVAEYGIPYEYVPFNSSMKVSSQEWNDYFEERLVEAVRSFSPEAVVFDGVWPYAGLLRGIRRSKVLSVWVRRGMWKPHISPAQLQRAPEFDLVIEPGDYASAFDVGATTKVADSHRVGPITVLNNNELLTRSQARSELGMAEEMNYVLVTLGAGNINDVSDIQSEFVDAVHDLGPQWRAVVTRATISNSASNGDSRAIELSVFPLARYARAFDFAVSAAGYNSYHEWINAGLPTIWVPNHETMTDDQAARSRFAEDVKIGVDLAAPDREQIRNTVIGMSNFETRALMSRRALEMNIDNGARGAADAIVTLLARRSKV